MTERRDRDHFGPRATRSPNRPTDAGVLELGGQAGNRAMAELLGHQPTAMAGASAGLRVRDALRVGRVPAQREFGLVAQRDLKDELKEFVLNGATGTSSAEPGPKERLRRETSPGSRQITGVPAGLVVSVFWATTGKTASVLRKIAATSDLPNLLEDMICFSCVSSEVKLNCLRSLTRKRQHRRNSY